MEGQNYETTKEAAILVKGFGEKKEHKKKLNNKRGTAKKGRSKSQFI